MLIATYHTLYVIRFSCILNPSDRALTRLMKAFYNSGSREPFYNSGSREPFYNSGSHEPFYNSGLYNSFSTSSSFSPLIF